ncbi:putative mediator of RNA polymerase II transcription subunit 10 [Aphidius gifuensis]|uniref:putative mediator of RNA polymerase II transcription subunit 10 n=1 Tax=Aphidius gifuensis TaxID=684658 RepID=UPI001CDD59F8|nr:putative mediator of RNA polymerase II transcription subunit 10 [Aphidius gifuensis]
MDEAGIEQEQLLCSCCRKNVDFLRVGETETMKTFHECLKDYQTLTIIKGVVYPVNAKRPSPLENNEQSKQHQEQQQQKHLKQQEKLKPSQQQEQQQQRKDKFWDDDVKEILIEKVKKRPPLWNYTLPIKERTAGITGILWDDIVQELTDQFPEYEFDVKEVKDKWKNLKDYFNRLKVMRKGTTGSAGGSQPDLWIHEKALGFLDEEIELDETISNIPCEPSAPVQFRRGQKRKNDSVEKLVTAVTNLVNRGGNDNNNNNNNTPIGPGDPSKNPKVIN